MTEALTLTMEEIGRPDIDRAPFRALLRNCFARRAALSLEVGPDRVQLSLDSLPPDRPVALEGWWRSARHAGSRTDLPDSRLLLPVLFYIRRLRLRHDQIQTLGTEFRPIGDFFMRNLLLALSGSAPTSVRDTARPADDLLAVSRSLQLHYCSVLKWVFPEDAFADLSLKEIADLLIASSHCELGRFENPILNRGTAAMRRTALSIGTAERHDRPADLAAPLLAARDRMMAHFG